MSDQFVHLISNDNDVSREIDSSTRKTTLNDINSVKDTLYFSRIPANRDFEHNNIQNCIDLFSAIYILSHYCERTKGNFFVLFIDKKLNHEMKKHGINGEYLLGDERRNVVITKEYYEVESIDYYKAYLNNKLKQLEGDLEVNEKLFKVLNTSPYSLTEICEKYRDFLDDYYSDVENDMEIEGDSDSDSWDYS